MSEVHVVIRRESVFDRLYEIRDAEIMIGRGRHCQIRLPDLYISREHALLVKSSQGLFIRDRGSRNRTIVDGILLHEYIALGPGSRVGIGSYELTFCGTMADAIREIGSIGDESTRSRNDNVSEKTDLTDRVEQLTAAQSRVYHGFVQGLSEKEVAASLGISVHTVHDHSKAIYKSFSVSSRGELLADWAKRRSQRTQSNE